jgi:glutaminase
MSLPPVGSNTMDPPSSIPVDPVEQQCNDDDVEKDLNFPSLKLIESPPSVDEQPPALMVEPTGNAVIHPVDNYNSSGSAGAAPPALNSTSIVTPSPRTRAIQAAAADSIFALSGVAVSSVAFPPSSSNMGELASSVENSVEKKIRDNNGGISNQNQTLYVDTVLLSSSEGESTNEEVHSAKSSEKSSERSLEAPIPKMASPKREEKERAASFTASPAQGGDPIPRTPVSQARVRTIRRLFKSLDLHGENQINQKDFMKCMERNGLTKNNPILKPCVAKMKKLPEFLSFEQFAEIINTDHFHVIQKALTGRMRIPDWEHFVNVFREIYTEVKEVPVTGQNASYIPQLAKVNRELFGISCCTTNGQMFSLGDSQVPFCAQSVSKPITYCMTLEEHGEVVTHQHVGREPSGRNFNDLSLNENNLPHNPMINSGAIMCVSLVRHDLDEADRFEYVQNIWKDLCGGRACGFSNPVYLSERNTADRNFALTYMMREANAFLPGVDIRSTLELYFQICSIEMDSEQMSIVAATLANGGVCPLTNKRIFSASTVRSCLSLMVSCGMYDFSGEWAYKIGLPAKSGVSGAVMVVVPNVCGFCIYSPPLDKLGNSVRGIAVANSFIERFNFHPFDTIVGMTDGIKEDPTRSKFDTMKSYTVQFLFAASEGDMQELSRLLAVGVDINSVDYDKRSALHLAAAEGQVQVVGFLLSNHADSSLRDRWGDLPIDAARRINATGVLSLLAKVAQ